MSSSRQYDHQFYIRSISIKLNCEENNYNINDAGLPYFEELILLQFVCPLWFCKEYCGNNSRKASFYFFARSNGKTNNNNT